MNEEPAAPQHYELTLVATMGTLPIIRRQVGRTLEAVVGTSPTIERLIDRTRVALVAPMKRSLRTTISSTVLMVLIYGFLNDWLSPVFQWPRRYLLPLIWGWWSSH